MSSAKACTIDAAGRLVIPKAIRQQAALVPGAPLEIRFRDGRVEIEPAPLRVRIERRGQVAVAVPSRPVPNVTPEEVEGVRRTLREERGASSE